MKGVTLKGDVMIETIAKFIGHLTAVSVTAFFVLYRMGLVYLICVSGYKIIFKYDFFSNIFGLALDKNITFHTVPHALWGWFFVCVFAWAALLVEFYKDKQQ